MPFETWSHPHRKKGSYKFRTTWRNSSKHTETAAPTCRWYSWIGRKCIARCERPEPLGPKSRPMILKYSKKYCRHRLKTARLYTFKKKTLTTLQRLQDQISRRNAVIVSASAAAAGRYRRRTACNWFWFVGSRRSSATTATITVGTAAHVL